MRDYDCKIGLLEEFQYQTVPSPVVTTINIRWHPAGWVQIIAVVGLIMKVWN